MSNISYLNPEEEQLLYRPKKPTPLDFFTPQEVSQMKTTELDEIRVQLDQSSFPRLSNTLFDLLAQMKISYKEKQSIKNKWLRNKCGQSEAH